MICFTRPEACIGGKLGKGASPMIPVQIRQQHDFCFNTGLVEDFIGLISIHPTQASVFRSSGWTDVRITVKLPSCHAKFSARLSSVALNNAELSKCQAAPFGQLNMDSTQDRY